MFVCVKYSVFIVLFYNICLRNFVSGKLDAESVYEFLSRRLDDVLTETRFLKVHMQNMDDRIMKVEQKIEGLATTTPYSSTRPVGDNEELEKDLKENINSQVLAVQKMLSTEKRLLRETVTQVDIKYNKFRSEIQVEMSAFKKAIFQEISNMNLSLEAKTELMYESINNNSFTLMNSISDLTSDLNITSYEWKQNLKLQESNLQSNIEQKHDDFQKSLSSVKKSLQADINSFQSNMSSVVSYLSSSLSSEVSLLTSQLSSLSSSVSSMSSILSSLTTRIREDQETKYAFAARIQYPSRYNYWSNEIVIFDDIVYNKGGGYDKSTGIFTVPRSGTYLFATNVEATDAGHAHVILSHGYGALLCEALAAKGFDNTGLCITVMYFHTGERVFVKAPFIYTYQYIYKHRSQFIGVHIF